MDTLTPPAAALATRASAPTDLLRERSRWRRWRGPLLCANAGLFLTLLVVWRFHPSTLRVEAWKDLSLVWLIGLGVTGLVALTLWLPGRRSAPLQQARSLDENLRAMNRLEAAALLESQSDPIARAQREETSHFLADHGPVRRGPDYLRILVLGMAALIVAHLGTLTVWTRPWQRPVTPPVKAALTPPPAAAPKASIVWKTPQSEIKASPVEEVPLTAVADSASGLRDLQLAAAVNGEPRPDVAIPADALAKPGAHPIETSLYLDTLDVQPYDVVSYFLRAKRIAKENFPDVVSPVQFVEVKPFRDDVREGPGLDGKGAFALLTALKVAQLNLLKQNFVLAHAEVSHEHASWKKENGRVGEEQDTLGAKTGEVVQKFIQEGASANIVDLLQQSRAQMSVSAEQIRAGQNPAALATQGKALGLITEIEKYFYKAAAKDGSSKGGPKNVKDPFAKPKDFEMKQRFETIAGGLEALAREQLKLAQELAKADPKDPDAGHPTPEPPGAEPKKPDLNRIEGTFTERQTLIAQRIDALLNGQALPPEVNTHLEGGQNHARESLRQLDAEDIAQAREPAAAAARELRLAVQAMDRLGNDAANDKLADALNRLNQAADKARDAAQAKSDAEARKAADDAAAAAADARDKLADAARQQQETGSAEAASRLAEATRALDDPKLRDALKQWHDQPRNDASGKAAADQLARAAERVADEQKGKQSSEDIAKLVERVERTRRNFERLVASATPGIPHGPVSAQAENAGEQRPGDASPSNNPPNGERLSADASSKAPPGQPGGKEAQMPGLGAEIPKDGLPSDKDGQGKTAHVPDGKGKEGRGNPGQPPNGKGNQGQSPGGKGKDGQGKEGRSQSGKGKAGQGKEGQSPNGKGESGQGRGQEGQGDGPGKEEEAAGNGQSESHEGEGQGAEAGSQSQGHGDTGHGEGQGQGNGEAPSEPGIDGQPTSRQGGRQGQGGSGSGHGRGAAQHSGEQPPADDRKEDAAPPDHSANNDPGKGNRGGPGRNPPSEQQARELLADLRDESLEARTILVSPDARQVLEELHPDIHRPQPRNNIAVVASFERIRGPLDRLITLLRAELERAQRQHELTDQTQERPPLAYGDAVADYFERLSRDYQPAPTPAVPADASASPTP